MAARNGNVQTTLSAQAGNTCARRGGELGRDRHIFSRKRGKRTELSVCGERTPLPDFPPNRETEETDFPNDRQRQQRQADCSCSPFTVIIICTRLFSTRNLVFYHFYLCFVTQICRYPLIASTFVDSALRVSKFVLNLFPSTVQVISYLV